MAEQTVNPITTNTVMEAVKEAAHGMEKPSEQLLPSQSEGVKVPDTLPASVSAGRDYKAEGYNDAKVIETERAKGEVLARHVIFAKVKELGGLPAATDWIEGYADFYSTDKNNGTRKTRKSEVQKVFDAWTTPKAGVTLDEARNKLENFVGGYTAWIELAGEIRGPRGGGRPQGAVAVNVSSAQFKKVDEQVPKMDLSQSLVLANKATRQLITASTKATGKAIEGEIALLRKMKDVDLEQLSHSDDEGIRKFGEDGIKRAEEIIKGYELMRDKQAADAKLAATVGAAEKPSKGTGGEVETEAPQVATQQAEVAKQA